MVMIQTLGIPISSIITSYRCIFQQSTTLFITQYSSTIAPNYFNCIIPDLKDVMANTNMTLSRVDLLINGDTTATQINGPTKLPEFQIVNYWTGASVSSGYSFAIGANVAVTGTFASSILYFCTFSVFPEQKKSIHFRSHHRSS